MLMKGTIGTLFIIGKLGDDYICFRALTGLNELGDEMFVGYIIAIDKGDKFAYGTIYSDIGRRSDATQGICRDSNGLYAIVCALKCGNVFPGVVSRAIVYDDDLKIGMGLGKHRLDGGIDVGLNVVGGYYDGHKRLISVPVGRIAF